KEEMNSKDPDVSPQPVKSEQDANDQTDTTEESVSDKIEGSEIDQESTEQSSVEQIPVEKPIADSKPDIASESTEVKDAAKEEREANQEDESVTGTVDDEHEDEEHEEEEHELLDIASMSKEELLKIMAEINEVEDTQLSKNKRKVADVRDAFAQILSNEKEKAFKDFIDGGGDEKDYVLEKDELEEKFFAAYKSFNKRRNALQKKEEKKREDNLHQKKELLDKMKDLIQNETNIQKAFSGFHSIQEQWRETGPVPGKFAKDIWLTYRHYVDSFYNLININRELRELDQKRNLEIKLKICEEAEDLLLESNINKATSALRVLQKKWRESGFVERSKSQEVWERFKSAVDKIYESRDAYREKMKSSFDDNAKAKELLIEQAKVYATFSADKHKDWQKKVEEIIELQKQWKKSGMVDKERSEKLWNAFRGHCDVFFNNKNDFYKDRKKDFNVNLQKKKDLCEQAESMVDSQDWRFATDEYKRLQAEWKKIGPVSEKYSNKIWHRFRTACDQFFKKKSEFYASREEGQEENYKKKIVLLEELEKLTFGDDVKENLNVLKDYQRKWSECGMVPIKKKAGLQTKYRKIIDKHFSSLKIDESEKRKIRFDHKLESIKNNADASGKIREQQKMISNKLRLLKSEVAVWENNIGFFANTKNAQSLKDEFDSKISKAKKEIAVLKEQLDMIKKS
ncbi:MAG: DUF349 domain-containing protein, partial [Bacteroidia bacterium]|nr:DUF349 domain-containing protein [Bacteroidia bacterium]